MAPACERVINDLLPKYLDNECYRVVCGDYKVNSDLLKLRWDKIFFTGSTFVGKIVMKAAAEHLTPVSLELGGKNPVIVDANPVNLEVAAKRLIWGKGVNFGQTCIAPDYVYVHEKVYDEFLILLKAKTEELYSTDQRNSPYLSRAINDRHYQRVKGLLEDSRDCVYSGGQTDDQDKFIDVTILTGFRIK
jgi:aldehyde dehydrogenase (NAD+)